MKSLRGRHCQRDDATGLPRDSVVNVTALVKLSKTDLSDRIGTVPANLMDEVDWGLRQVLDL